MFHWHQIWKHMHDLTNSDIEKRAIMQLIQYFEPKIDAVIKQSELELKKINQNRALQGLNTKKRIDEECVKRAIKNINTESISTSPNGGGETKTQQSFKTHLPTESEISEVH